MRTEERGNRHGSARRGNGGGKGEGKREEQRGVFPAIGEAIWIETAPSAANLDPFRD
jgi:hypothetical protein